MRLRFLVAIAAVAAVGALGAIGLAFAKGGNDRSTFFATLSGKNELDASLHKGAGDPDGSGGAVVTIDGTTLCYGVTVMNIETPTAAHIHIGKKNVNGPVVVPFTAPATGDPGASSGCAGVTADLAAAIAKHPNRYYVNVHNATYPGGAVRGQLSKKH
jgi:hypothetical protein